MYWHWFGFVAAGGLSQSVVCELGKTRVKKIYKITYYPVNKIYIGKDSIGSYRYYGSPNMDIVNADFEKLPDKITWIQTRSASMFKLLMQLYVRPLNPLVF